jgi:predicted negative regulator of RcsB-dependent stress response
MPGIHMEKIVTRTNLLFLLVGAILVGGSIYGYQTYQARKEPQGVQINVGPNGVTFEKR